MASTLLTNLQAFYKEGQISKLARLQRKLLDGGQPLIRKILIKG